MLNLWIVRWLSIYELLFATRTKCFKFFMAETLNHIQAKNKHTLSAQASIDYITLYQMVPFSVSFYNCILTIISTCTRTSYTLLAYRTAKSLPATILYLCHWRLPCWPTAALEYSC
uniref:Secreted protein n=1 Tax=Setaria viridis TaxID=4556 RepID=A0A4V6DD88_SETVI|nr:hypothetical protein SEVIR_3G312403v2 [Setaria viridis]TKW28347.1 hypothetical protein SEVIR_3G312403v2 [Setaria viridis]TKW28348.1 hypothetical protein SEVIR_3G312403v2 [Setaria viridis]